jgi:hypothetical protein
MTLCTLLWRNEALAELDMHGAAAGVRSKPNWVLWERLSETVESETLRSVVRERLKARTEWRVEKPQSRGA